MISTVAVGTDGSDTADKAVDFAIDLAQKYGARLVAISSYKPVSESRLKQEQKDAPDEIQWSINPTEDVDSILSDLEEKAQEAGLAVTTVAGDGSPPTCWSTTPRSRTRTCWWSATRGCSAGSSAASRTASPTRRPAPWSW